MKKRVLKRWARPLIRTNFIAGLKQYSKFIRDWKQYKKMPGAENIDINDTYPCLFDNIGTFSPGSHYYYQDIWAFKKILNSGIALHVDVGSKADLISFLTAITKVEFVDIRPLDAPYLDNLKSIEGSILEMPYENNSILSLSSLHVAEHIGLGRYGDPLDPFGTKMACKELARCLSKGGDLYFSLPVGKDKVCFNAHRIHSPKTILEYFDNLKLVEFSVYTDSKDFLVDVSPDDYNDAKFACGMFHFTKE